MVLPQKDDSDSARAAPREADEKDLLRRKLLEMIKRNEALRQAKPR